jgi:hypothetical protein
VLPGEEGKIVKGRERTIVSTGTTTDGEEEIIKDKKRHSSSSTLISRAIEE